MWGSLGPAGAIVAGWDSHPLKNAALTLRTPEGVIRFLRLSLAPTSTESQPGGDEVTHHCGEKMTMPFQRSSEPWVDTARDGLASPASSTSNLGVPASLSGRKQVFHTARRNLYQRRERSGVGAAPPSEISPALFQSMRLPQSVGRSRGDILRSGKTRRLLVGLSLQTEPPHTSNHLSPRSASCCTPRILPRKLL